MIDQIKRGVNYLLEHYVLALMLLALAALTLGGVGSPSMVAVVGLLLCAAGLSQQEGAVADLWVMVPLAAYLLLGMASSFVSAGRLVGFTSTQPIFLALYLLMASLGRDDLALLRRLAVLWGGCVAVHGLVTFLAKALDGRAGRLGGLLGNPNALGAFLVAVWFGLTASLPDEAEKSPLAADLRRLEPLLLTTQALTLSMGSFVALAAGMLFLAVGWARRDGWKPALLHACRMLAKAGLAMGLGVLMHFAALRTGAPWLCLVLAAYLIALAALWPQLDRFLRDLPWAAASMTAAGGLVAIAAILIRPSSIATFAERLEMMRNGLGYLFTSPLLGVGPAQWRILNMADGDTYFNTWHIHNVPLHIGVELGVPAMIAVIIIIVRAFRKKGPNRAGFTAYVLHNLIDTSFFYLGISSMALVFTGEPSLGGKRLSKLASRLLFAALAVLFLYIMLSRGVFS